jgi:hypothetical protein
MAIRIAEIRWDRLDTEGEDSCALFREPQGWRLAGRARFIEDGRHHGLVYSAQCDGAWNALAAHVTGTVDDEKADAVIEKQKDGSWHINGVAGDNTTDCPDIDLAFTPSTNLLAIRRMHLKIGEEGQSHAAYLNVPGWTLDRLEQSYRRLNDTHYAYHSPRGGYHETLDVSEVGFVLSYPHLWRGKLLRTI